MNKIMIGILSVVMVISLAGCGTGDRSPSSCVADADCCSGAGGYSHDGGTSCYSDSACSTACTSTCIADATCCSGAGGFSRDGGATCFHNSNCSSGCSGSTVTELKFTNTTSTAVTIGFVNNAADGSTGACPNIAELLTAEELSTAGWCTDYEAGVEGAGKCLKTLGASGSTTASVYVPNPDNKCIAGNFGAGGFASCQTTAYPNGWTQGEFTLNPKATTEEAVDISAVNGVNYPVTIIVPGAWVYEDSTSVEDNTVGPNNELGNNIGVKGVFPSSCTDCIQLVGTIPCSGLTPDPPTCNTSRICNVYRDNAPGDTVEFKLGEKF